MDPITHFMTGACLSRAGFNRKTAYATLAMTLATEAPDIDVRRYKTLAEMEASTALKCLEIDSVISSARLLQ